MKLLAGCQDYTHGGTQKDEYTEEEVQAVPCPLCGDEAGERLYTEHSVIGVVRCDTCGLIYTSPRLHSPERIYWGDPKLYYAEARLIFEGRAAHHRDPNYLAELATIERYQAHGRLLDVGCNMGMLLRLARQRGWDAVGLEPSPSLAGLAEKWGAKVYNCFLAEIPEEEHGSFDVVALSDVFEHISEPRSFLEEASRLLKPSGVLYAKVPNARWNILKQRALSMLGHRPRQGLWDSYEHVVHYTEETLKRMLETEGLKVVAITTEPPVQTPNWHEHVGHYYQYPTPWVIDWRRKIVRSGAYGLAFVEKGLRLGRLGYLAQNIVAVARRS